MISEGCRGQADGIVEEAAQKIDAALALADQHDQVFRLRIVRRLCRRQMSAKLFKGDGTSTFTQSYTPKNEKTFIAL